MILAKKDFAEFIKDYESLPTPEMCAKWDCSRWDIMCVAKRLGIMDQFLRNRITKTKKDKWK
jgi:hypothetical protein